MGKFELFYDAVDGFRYPVPGGTKVLSSPLEPASEPIEPGQGVVFEFQAPSSPPPERPGEYVLVFTGDAGEEKAAGDSPGFVVSNIIGARSGALYMLVASDQGHLYTLVTDSGRARALPSQAFDPLNHWRQYQLSELYWNKKYKAVPRTYIGRQVRHGQGIFRHEYKTMALRIMEGGALARTYVATDDPAWAAVGYKPYNGWRWLLRSENPQVGSFILGQPSYTQIPFDREYFVEGVRNAASGMINYTLPPTALQTIDLSKAVISGDGTSVSEITTSVSTGGTTSDEFCNSTSSISTTTTFHDMQLTPGLPPSVGWVATGSVSTSGSGSANMCTGSHRTSSVESVERKTIGYINGAKEFYTAQFSATAQGFHSGNGPGCGGGGLEPPYASSSSSLVWMLSSGGGGYSTSCDGVVSTQSGQKLNFDYQIDGNIDNAVLVDAASNTFLFRGQDVTNLDFVRDVSPLGEVFFSKPDGTGLVHEPRAGRPRFVLPPGTRAVLGAIFF